MHPIEVKIEVEEGGAKVDQDEKVNEDSNKPLEVSNAMKSNSKLDASP